jgi:hypothetical protein
LNKKDAPAEVWMRLIELPRKAASPITQSNGLSPRPRLVPAEPFPPYAFVSGRFPHPTSDPAGHSFGKVLERPAAPDAERWSECVPYLRGIDLFNHGYYWEAHEVWEGLWHACGQTGPIATFLQGLIKLAAAGVKVREGVPEGVRSHADRAAELFGEAAPGQSGVNMMGLSLDQLAAWAKDVAANPPVTKLTADAPVEIVFPFVLAPQCGNPNT